jgi:two-component system, LytTR family, sensor kinase
MTEATRFPLERRTLLAIWAAGWSAALVIMVGDIWMQFVVRGVPFFSEWYYAPRAITQVLIGAVLSLGVFIALRRWVGPVRPLPVRILCYIPIAVAYWLAWSTISAAFHVLVWPGPPDTLGSALRQSSSGWAFNSLLIFAVIAILFEAILNMARVSREETRASRYAAEASRAQSAALAAQLDPHFLFNTLHVASGLMRRDVDAARRVLGDLTGLLDQSFRREGRRMVRLGDEIRLVERYLRIQRARFGERLEVEFQVDPGASGAPIPPLLIQPLVENAIQHGIAREREGGRIRIEVRCDPDAISILVENTGPAPNSGSPPGINERIGLGGVRARLRSVFGEAARLDIQHDPSGTFTAAVTLPSLRMDPRMEDHREPFAFDQGAGNSDSPSLGDGYSDGSSRPRPWGWPRWVAVGALAWLGVTILYHIVLGFRRLSMGLPFYSSWGQLAPNSSLFLIGAGLTPPVVLLLWNVRRRIRSVPLVAVLYISVGLAFWALWSTASYYVFPLMLGIEMAFSQLLAMSAFVGLALYTGLALMVEATWQLHRARQMAMEAAALRADLLAAETAALQSKVSPHLLFDSLALASDLMRHDVRAARSVLSDVGELLRVSLGRNGDPFVSLKQELEHLRRVLDIHVGRGHGRAPVELDLVGGAGERMVPRLVLQPWAGELARRAVGACGTPARILIRGEPAGPDRLKLFARIECGRVGDKTVDVRLSEPDVNRVREWLATAHGFDHGVLSGTSPDGTSSLEFMAPEPNFLPQRSVSMGKGGVAT